MNTTFWKKGLFALLLAGILTGCAQPASSQPQPGASEEETTEETEPADAADDAETALTEPEMDLEHAALRVGALKGPTTIGLLPLIEETENDDAPAYEFVMETDASALSAQMIAGDLDIALVPANLASVLYNRTEGGVAVVDINTLGVLECVSADDTIEHIADLKGATVLSTGQGATPEYAIRYLLDAYGVDDCEIEFHSEAQEIAALLQENPDQIAILPQPFATVTTLQNDALSLRFSLTDEWSALETTSRLVTGVTIVRREILDETPEAVEAFLEAHKNSVDAALADPDHTAELIVAKEIIGAAGPAKAALPRCNIVCVTGAEMTENLMGYLETLFEADPSSVGGALPADDFYYAGQ